SLFPQIFSLAALEQQCGSDEPNFSHSCRSLVFLRVLCGFYLDFDPALWPLFPRCPLWSVLLSSIVSPWLKFRFFSSVPPHDLAAHHRGCDSPLHLPAIKRRVL